MTCTLTRVLAGHLGPGAYRWSATYDVDRVRDVVEEEDWTLAHLDGVGIVTVGDLHDTLADALDLPSYYGRNLDALHDALREVDPQVVVLWDDWGGFARSEPRVFGVVCDLLGEHHVLLLRGPGPQTAAPALD